MERLSRREVLRRGGLAMLGGLAWSCLPAGGWGAASSRDEEAGFSHEVGSSGGASAAPLTARRRRVLVVLFLRGAADGLSLLVPYTEAAYYAQRPGLAIAPPGRPDGCLDLDGRFGLHPALAPLLPHYKHGVLAPVCATGSPDPTRSHFDAQDSMETGVLGSKRVTDGWLDRCLQLTARGSSSVFRGVSCIATLPRSLQGSSHALALPSLDAPGLRGGGLLSRGFQAMYGGSADPALRTSGREAFDAFEVLRQRLESSGGAAYRPAGGARYPSTSLGRQLEIVARLVKADVGLEVACAEVGGWDTHANQGGAQGLLARVLHELAQAVDALVRDLGDHMEDVVLLTMSEFGRTVAQNGTGGTDHGHGSMSFVLGGGVRGGRVHGRWPGLARDQLFEGRDLAVTTDFRDVMGELAVRHLGCGEARARLFPGYPLEDARFCGVLAATPSS